MKQLYTLILLSALTTTALAQDFVYASGQHRVDTVLNENYESYEISIITPSPEDITFKWEIISNTFDPNWSCSVCDYSGCYVGFPPSATMTPITASEMASGTNGFIKCNITCGANYGDGKVEIYVYDQNDYNRGDTVSFFIHWPAPATGIEETKLSLNTYPNPVSDQLTIANESSVTGDVVVTDLLGKVVHTTTIQANATRRLNFSDLRSGVYLVSLKAENGAITTKKITKR